MRDSLHNLLCEWQHRLLALAAVLIGGLIIAPRDVQASCGDYVLIEGVQGERNASSTLASGHSETNRGNPICQGAGCRQRRDLPAPPPSRVTLDKLSPGVLTALMDLPPEPCLFRHLSTEPVNAISSATGIFRPPRPDTNI